MSDKDQIQSLRNQVERLETCLKIVVAYFDIAVGWKSNETGTLREAINAILTKEDTEIGEDS